MTTQTEALKRYLDDCDKHAIVPDIAGAFHFAWQEALAQPEQEPVAWPCVIAEADFSENTVTLAMQCTDYKVSAGKHWLSTTPPQRTWVGLTDEQIEAIAEEFGVGGWICAFARAIEAKLKEKNDC